MCSFFFVGWAHVCAHHGRDFCVDQDIVTFNKLRNLFGNILLIQDGGPKSVPTLQNHSFFYMIHFTLYSRSYCHLCDEMRIALEELLSGIPYQLTVLDIDKDPDLLDLYDELVPVLFGKKKCDLTITGAGKELCHYLLDPVTVKEFCNG